MGYTKLSRCVAKQSLLPAPSNRIKCIKTNGSYGRQKCYNVDTRHHLTKVQEGVQEGRNCIQPKIHVHSRLKESWTYFPVPDHQFCKLHEISYHVIAQKLVEPGRFSCSYKTLC